MSSDASLPKNAYAGVKVVVMGLGLNGGGLESARFLASRGAEVTVTDLRDEKVLEPSLAKLNGFPIRYVLGRHEQADFAAADFIVKNPAVKPDSPFLAAAKRIETDLSIFLSHCPGRLIAVTGSKGKSSTASALHWALTRSAAAASRSGKADRKAFLGGNITISPLGFLDAVRPGDDVVLELSSWQLGDLAFRTASDRSRDALDHPRALLKPRVAILTAIMADHLDRYGSMDEYVADKRFIYAGQDGEDVTVTGDDAWGRSFAAETKGRVLVYSAAPLPEGVAGGWLDGPSGEGPGIARTAEGSLVEIVPETLLTPGSHQKRNLLAAALALLDLGHAPHEIREGLGSFPGIEHRLEFFHEAQGVRFYNDSAATIPEAAAAAIASFRKPPVLVAGGNDKALDFAPLVAAAQRAKAIFLLAGTGSAKLAPELDKAGIRYGGPFDRLDDAVKAAAAAAEAGDVVVLSPGCTSFGMFQNEFDRGRKWKEAVNRLVL